MYMRVLRTRKDCGEFPATNIQALTAVMWSSFTFQQNCAFHTKQTGTLKQIVASRSTVRTSFISYACWCIRVPLFSLLRK